MTTQTARRAHLLKPRGGRAALAGIAVVVLLGACSVTGADGPRSSPDASPVAFADASASRSTPDASGSPDETQLTIERLEARTATDGTDVAALTELGLAYLQRARESGDPGDYGRAEEALDSALSLQPDYAEALVGSGILALARHDFATALELGERARAVDPSSPGALGVIADAQTELGRYEDALATVQAMLDRSPSLSSYARVSYQRELHGQLDGAIEAMRTAFQAGVPGSENAEYVRVLLGNLHFSRGDLDQAEQIYTESLDARPEFVYALAGLARVRAAQGRTDEAVELFEAAIARNPLPEFVIALAETLEAAGRTDEAQRQYELVRAIQQLFAANGVDVDLDLALFEANHGDDPNRAVELARAAYERTPNVRAADALAWALHVAGDNDEAAGYAAEALGLGTLDSSFLYHAGAIAAARGEDALAREHLERALDLNPHFSPLFAPRARELLEQIEARGGTTRPRAVA
jgi:tetratricopeptide (TPR) repeat protein